MKKRVRTYVAIGTALLVFTGITVAANRLSLAVPAAISVALIIATIKGSMVGAVFMHLSHEKKWIYGALLLTVVLFAALMLIPILTVMDTYGAHVSVPSAVTQEGAQGH